MKNRNKIREIFITVLLLTISSADAQNTGTGIITGKVIEASTKQPVIGANVIVIGTDQGAATDAAGNFRIENVPANEYQVRASAIGYDSETKADVVVNPTRPVVLEFELKEKVIELEGVVIESGYFSKDPALVNSTKSFSYEEIRRAPGGFEDVIRALSVLPGVGQAEPGRNDLMVRGGAPSENLYLLDGIEVQNINHFGTQGATGGPLSYINLDFVKGTTFSTGGFPVLYGDKISSVLSIDLRDGRNDRLGGKATVSATQFGLNLEGPLNNSSSFIFSARRSYLDFIFKAADFGFVPEYYDLLTKFNYSIDNNNSLSFLFTGAFDNVRYFNDTEEQRYDNSRVLGSDQTQYVTGISYRHLFNNGFFNLSLSRNFVDYDTQQRDTLLNPLFKNISREQVNSLRGDAVYKLFRASEINFGAKVEYIKFKADVLIPTFLTSFGDTLPNTEIDNEDNFYKSSAYLNFNTTFFGRLSANLGVRGDYFNPIEKKFYISPRFSVSYRFTDLTSINFSTGI
ncbi:MAG: TonB-dependent receptor, partial [Ignavibacteriaceae bacterium]